MTRRDDPAPSHATVTLRTPDGEEHALIHGDVIGRLHTAALHLDDGRVSEAHALVSLRDGGLRLLSLRGVFSVDGRTVDDLKLQAGQRVLLAPGLALEVTEVTLPQAVLGVEGPHLARRVLPAVCSLWPGPRLQTGWHTDAAAWIWSTGAGWTLREGGHDRPLAEGDTWDTLRFVAVPIGSAGQDRTRQGGVDGPLRIVANYDTVHIHREGRSVVTLAGVLARLVSELVALGGPVSWQALCAELWPELPDPAQARARLDTSLARIRRKLRAMDVRADLLHMDGAGSVELLLRPQDQVEDRT